MEETMAYDEREYSALRCLISVPPGSVDAGGWPLLLFLHGSQEAAPMDLRAALTAHGPLRPSSGSVATQRFLVVAPQLPAPGGDVWGAHAAAVRAIARAVARDYQGDLTRCYLTGFSFGGNGVVDIGPRQGETWAALWAVDPTRAPLEASTRPIWVSAGDRARPNKESFRVVWGVRDRLPDSPSDRVYEDAGLDHVPTATAAYRDEAIYEWLLKHRSAG
jgi:predicted peptidase